MPHVITRTSLGRIPSHQHSHRLSDLLHTIITGITHTLTTGTARHNHAFIHHIPLHRHNHTISNSPPQRYKAEAPVPPSPLVPPFRSSKLPKQHNLPQDWNSHPCRPEGPASAWLWGWIQARITFLPRSPLGSVVRDVAAVSKMTAGRSDSSQSSAATQPKGLHSVIKPRIGGLTEPGSASGRDSQRSSLWSVWKWTFRARPTIPWSWTGSGRKELVRKGR